MLWQDDSPSLEPSFVFSASVSNGADIIETNPPVGGITGAKYPIAHPVNTTKQINKNTSDKYFIDYPPSDEMFNKKQIIHSLFCQGNFKFKEELKDDEKFLS